MPPRHPVRVILASASPARLALLRSAGIDPHVVVSGVDEEQVTGSPEQVALTLATHKAEAVAARVHREAIVVGCDSVLDLDGVPLGKPTDAGDAIARWQQMRGRTGVLRTGHVVIRTFAGPGSPPLRSGAVAATTVRFGRPSDDEIAAYVATGEPLRVAGAFTLDGRGGWFVDGIDGDHGNVLGLSLPLLGRLLRDVGVSVTDLW